MHMSPLAAGDVNAFFLELFISLNELTTSAESAVLRAEKAGVRFKFRSLFLESSGTTLHV